MRVLSILIFKSSAMHFFGHENVGLLVVFVAETMSKTKVNSYEINSGSVGKVRVLDLRNLGSKPGVTFIKIIFFLDLY